MKLKKGESRAEEDLVRNCAKCGTPLPSNHEQKNCDSCNRKESGQIRNVAFIILGGIGGLLGLGKYVLPKIIKKL